MKRVAEKGYKSEELFKNLAMHIISMLNSKMLLNGKRALP
jgi:hypothetical protein